MFCAVFASSNGANYANYILSVIFVLSTFCKTHCLVLLRYILQKYFSTFFLPAGCRNLQAASGRASGFTSGNHSVYLVATCWRRTLLFAQLSFSRNSKPGIDDKYKLNQFNSNLPHAGPLSEKLKTVTLWPRKQISCQWFGRHGFDQIHFSPCVKVTVE